MNEANAHRGNTACVGDNELDYDENDVVHVVPDGGSSSSGNNGSDNQSDIEKLTAQVAALSSLIAQYISSGAGSSACPPVSLYSVSYGQRNAAVMQLQTWLISSGGQGGVITYGATGYYGDQTARAVANFAASHPNCK